MEYQCLSLTNKHEDNPFFSHFVTSLTSNHVSTFVNVLCCWTCWTNQLYIYTTRYYKSYLGRRIYPTPKEMQDGTSFWERWAEMATPVWFSLPSLLSFWLELSIWMSNPQFLAEFWVQFTAESQESICGVFVALGCCLTVVTLKDSHMLHVWNIYQHLP